MQPQQRLKAPNTNWALTVDIYITKKALQLCVKKLNISWIFLLKGFVDVVFRSIAASISQNLIQCSAWHQFVQKCAQPMKVRRLQNIEDNFHSTFCLCHLFSSVRVKASHSRNKLTDTPQPTTIEIQATESDKYMFPKKKCIWKSLRNTLCNAIEQWEIPGKSGVPRGLFPAQHSATYCHWNGNASRNDFENIW